MEQAMRLAKDERKVPDSMNEFLFEPATQPQGQSGERETSFQFLQRGRRAEASK